MKEWIEALKLGLVHSEASRIPDLIEAGDIAALV
jgi:hypothetical protein